MLTGEARRLTAPGALIDLRRDSLPLLSRPVTERRRERPCDVDAVIRTVVRADVST